nr:hypothetical protein [Clostridium amylolyticum]
MDDFAMKKRHIYGTVMIDTETKKIINLLDSRDLDDVVKWLKTYLNLKIVSRDRSLTYAAAIRKAHSNAIQCHLLKNLTDYCKNYITKKMKFKIKIKQALCNNGEKTSNNNIGNRKSTRIKEAQHLNSLGLTEREISLQLKMDIRTVKNILIWIQTNYQKMLHKRIMKK